MTTPEAAPRRPVPVLVIAGAAGAGKSTIAAEAFRLLRETGVASAFVDLATLGAWPPPPDDPWNERLVHANLACMWSNLAAIGARCLVVCRVLEARSLLRHIEAAVPGAQITVIGL
jgi:adenylylsulfate kinase